MPLLTKSSRTILLSSPRSSGLEVKTSNSIIGIFSTVFGSSMAIPNSHATWSLPQSNTTLTQNRLVESIPRCTQVTGGGLYRYVRFIFVLLICSEASQMSLESQHPGATIIPLIVSSDKTQLTLFHSKMAYPVYLTIGNIPKDICQKPSHRAQMLIAYLPTSKLEQIKVKATRHRALRNLFHACMRHLLGLISPLGEVGIPMVSGDGVWRRCHPVFATFVGNYPEQTLVTCTYYGCCPKCLVHLDQLGEHRHFPGRDHNKVIEAYLQAEGEDTRPFHAACHEAGVKPVFHPFWESFLLVDIFLSITPDILHQLLQGVVKHLISWVTSSNAFRPAAINARCRVTPPNHHITLFPKGISKLSHVSGKEYKAICSILLGLMVDLPLPGGQLPTRVLRAVHALLDFVYLAQFQCHTIDMIHCLEDSLTHFHENKAIFTDLGI